MLFITSDKHEDANCDSWGHRGPPRRECPYHERRIHGAVAWRCFRDLAPCQLQAERTSGLASVLPISNPWGQRERQDLGRTGRTRFSLAN